MVPCLRRWLLLATLAGALALATSERWSGLDDDLSNEVSHAKHIQQRLNGIKRPQHTLKHTNARRRVFQLVPPPSPPPSSPTYPPTYPSPLPSPSPPSSPSPLPSPPPPPPPVNLMYELFSNGTYARDLDAWAAPYANGAVPNPADANATLCSSSYLVEPGASFDQCVKEATILYGLIKAGHVGAYNGSTSLTFSPFDNSLTPYTLIDTEATMVLYRAIEALNPAIAFGTWDAYRCDPTKGCCPNYGMTPASSMCSSFSAAPAAGSCQFSIACAPITDSCAKYTNDTACLAGPGCLFQAPLGSTTPVCFNATRQVACGDIDASMQALVAYGSSPSALMSTCSSTEGCAVVPRCKPLPAPVNDTGLLELFTNGTFATEMNKWAAAWDNGAQPNPADFPVYLCEESARVRPGLTIDRCIKDATTFYGLVKSGYVAVPAVATELQLNPFYDGSVTPYTTLDAASSTTIYKVVANENSEAMFRIFASVGCDPSLPCCPKWGMTYQPGYCSAATSGMCEASVSCVISSDECAQYVSRDACAAAGCEFRTSPYFANNLIYPRIGTFGNYSTCVNATRQTACGTINAAMQFARTMGSDPMAYAAQCSDAEGCFPVPACTSVAGYYQGPGTDSCFVPHEGSEPVTEETCTARIPLLNGGTAFAGGCKNATVCVTGAAANPCVGFRDPFTCNAQQGNCIFVPNAKVPGLFSGTCRMTQDPCNALGADVCESVTGCKAIASCETNRCDPNDQCCSLDPLSCALNTACDNSGFECMPAYDDCGLAQSATACTSGSRSHCGWDNVTATCRIVDLGRHPCRSAAASASVDACTQFPDYTLGASSAGGASLCVVQTTCKSVCAKCQAAVQKLVDLTAPYDALTNSTALANAWMSFCTNQLITIGLAQDWQCGMVWMYIESSNNGWFFKRPTAIAQILGLCPDAESELKCTITVNTTAGPVTGPTSTCTREGVDNTKATWVGGNSPYATAATLAAGYCRADTDCTTEGYICSPDGGSLPMQLDCFCSLADGSDECYPLGQCMNFCAAPATLDTLLGSNWFLTNVLAGTCTGDADCRTADQQCNTQGLSAFSVEVCDAATKSTKPQTISGVCRAKTEPAIVKAFFDPTLAFLAVQFNYNVPLTSFPCKELFDDATIALIGEDSSCDSSGQYDPGMLYVFMSNAWTVAPGSVLAINATQTVLAEPVWGKPFTGSVTVGTGCATSDLNGNLQGLTGTDAACLKPQAIIIAPDDVYAPCAGSTAGTPFSLDGSLSVDTSGKELATFLWTYTGTGTNTLASAITAQSTLSTVDVDGTALATLPAGSYSVTLVVTNFMGIASAPATATVTMVQGSYAPSFFIDGPPEQTFVLADDGLFLDVVMDPTSICDGLTPAFEWSFKAGSSTFDIAAVRTQSTLSLTPTELAQANAKAGSTYQLVLKGDLVDAQGAASAPTPVQVEVTVVFAGSPLQLEIEGPSGWVPSTQTVVLNAKATDPDNAKGATLLYTWTCAREDSKPCFSDSTTKGTQTADGKWQFEAANLATGLAHTFTATVTAADGTRRTASVTQTITPKAVAAGAPPMPTGNLTYSCIGGPCPPKIDPTRPVAMILTMDPMFLNSTLRWYSPTAKSLPEYTGSFVDNQYTLLPSQFPTGVNMFMIHCDITTCNGDQCRTGRIIDKVNLARAPICTKPKGCAETKVVRSVFPNEVVEVTATGMAAPDKGVSIVSYTFGYVLYSEAGTATEILGGSSSSTTFQFTGLGVGSFSFWVIGTDSNGATIKSYANTGADKVVITFPASATPARRLTQASCLPTADLLTKLNSKELSVSGNTNAVIKRWAEFTKVLDTSSCTIAQLLAADKTTLCSTLASATGYVQTVAPAIKATDYQTFAKAAYPAALTAKLAASRFLGCTGYVALCTTLNGLGTSYLSALRLSGKYGDNATFSAFASAATYCGAPVPTTTTGRRLQDAASTAVSVFRVYDEQAYATEKNVAPGLPYYTYVDPAAVFSFAYALETPAGLTNYNEKVGSAAATMNGGYATACLTGAIASCPKSTNFSLYNSATVPILLSAWAYTTAVPAGSVLVSTSAVTVNFGAASAAANFKLCPTKSANAEPMPSCGITVTLPVAAAATTLGAVSVAKFNASMATACLRIVVNAATPAWASDATYVAASYDAVANTVTCSSAAIGTFLVVQYPPSALPPAKSPTPSPVPSPSPTAGGSPSPVPSPTPSPSPSTTLQDNQKQVALKFAGATYAFVMLSFADFATGVETSTKEFLVNTLKYNAASTTVVLQTVNDGARRSLLQTGGVTGTVLVTLPAGVTGAEATTSMRSLIAAAETGSVFPTSFRTTYGITGVTGTVVNPSPTSAQPEEASKSNKSAIIIGCVVGIGGAFILAALVAAVIVMRRRRMAVGPRTPAPAAAPAAATGEEAA